VFGLKNKTAIVTGAASGIGKAIAIAYAKAGANIAIIDVSQEGAESTAESISSLTPQIAKAFICDITQSDKVKDTVLKIIEKFGSIDILVNCAGIGMRSPAEEMTDEMWDTVINTNLRSVFLLCREIGKQMIKQNKGGRIINIASVSAVVGIETGNINYSASKGGIISMSRCLALEWAKHNILVNNIAPSHVKTKLIEKLMKDSPETKKYFLNNIPLGRLGTVEEVAGPAVFLASDAAAFITGHTLLVDGGHTAK
jgi:NAD(P)-dependent dehydrogenase (short-subunit alcohol dehydrogenase family)